MDKPSEYTNVKERHTGDMSMAFQKTIEKRAKKIRTEPKI